MGLRLLLSRKPGQLINIFRTRYGRFSNPVCRHDPSEIMAFITTRCNLTCHTCPFTQASPFSPPPDIPDLDPAFFDHILDEYHNCTLVGLVGGEPLLHKDVFRLISVIERHRMTSHLSTNGVLLDDNMVIKLLDTPLEILNISLDAIDADGYQRLRNSPASMFQRIQKNIEKICTERTRRKAPLQIGLSFVTDRHNIEEIPAFARWALDIGADQVLFQNLLPYECSDITVSNNILTDTQANREKLANLKLPSGIRVSLPVLTPINENVKCVHCIHPFKMLSFDGAGNLSPCCIIPPHPQYGSLKESIDRWRNAPALIKIRSDMLNGNEAFSELCLHCWERFSMGQHEEHGNQPP